jgi:hypothetical protein
MAGLNKYTDKERRAIRRSFQSNEVAHDLHSNKYRQRVKQRADRFYEEEIEHHERDEDE